MTEDQVSAICNRHLARLLTQLTEANCPQIFVEAVKGKIQWLRADLIEAVRASKPPFKSSP